MKSRTPSLKSEASWFQIIHAEITVVTSAMHKNARWSGMNVNSLRMGNLGNSMGLRSGRVNMEIQIQKKAIHYWKDLLN
ncbi:unnamed protein product [Rhizopus stolonifer]